MTFRSRLPLALSVLVLGCASAAERLEQGIELEGEGHYLEAASRYVDALEKDASLAEARRRLRVAADSAIAQGLRAAELEAESGDPVTAAEVHLVLDRLLERTRDVGVSPTLPDGYDRMRRAALDDAIDELMLEGRRAAADGRWSQGRTALRRVRDDFHPDAEQARAAAEAEADHMVAWAEAELAAGRFRTAFELTEEVLEFGVPLPDPTAEIAVRLRAQALARGTRRLVVLPVSHRTEVGTVDGTEMALQLADVLELEYWRAPPRFVAVADPARVRRLVRRHGPRELDARAMRGLLEDVDGHLLASIELVAVTRAEHSVRSEARRARTREGSSVTYRIEEGQLRYEARVDVLLLDDRGNDVGRFDLREDHVGSFRRGVFEGDPGELSLGRNEARLFDPGVVAEQYRSVRDGLVEKLAREIGPRILDRALSRVP